MRKRVFTFGREVVVKGGGVMWCGNEMGAVGVTSESTNLVVGKVCILHIEAML